MVSQVIAALINVAALAMLGNYLHAEGYGRYAFYYALVPLIGALGDFGVGMIVTREIARDPDSGPRIYGDALIVKGLASALVLLAVGVIAFTQFEPAHAVLLLLVTAAALTEMAQDPTAWVFRAYERQDLEALLLTISQVVRIGGIALGVWLRLPLDYMIGVAAVSFGLRVAIGAVIVHRRYYAPRFVIDWARIGALIREGLPFGFAMLGVVLYARIGVLLLQALAGAKDVAYFNVAYMLSQPLGFISTAVSMSAYPLIARYAKQDPAALRAALHKNAKYQLIVTLPMTVGLFLLSERVLPLLFHGDEFARAGTAMRLMSLGLPVIFLNLTARYVLTAMDRQQTYLHGVVAGLIANTALCFLLIPRLGFVGGVIAYLGAELAILAVSQVALAGHVSPAHLLRESARPALAALGMGAVIVLAGALPLAAVIALGMATYAVLLIVFRALSSSELQVLRGVYVSFRLPGSAYLSRAGQRT